MKVFCGFGFVSIRVLFFLTQCLAAAVFAMPSDSVRSHLSLRTFTDFGHIVNGTNSFADTTAGISKDLSMQPLNRAGFTAIQELQMGNFDVVAGIAGLIWWPYGGGITDADERAMQGRASIPVARARWQFGNPEETSGSLMLGTFTHKYNPDAKNLGEYLYRSGTYPGFLWTTEGWLLMNRANQYANGAMLSVSQFHGKLKHNFSLLMQTTYFPVGDFSPGYDFSFTHKWFELGGGAVFHNYLSIRPSALERKDPENTYVHATVNTASGQKLDYFGPKDKVPGYYYVSDNLIYRFQDDPSYTETVSHIWTHKGIKVMGRAALNLNSLLPESSRNPEDLRFFAEVAVLGWENQPLYYENRSERMPIMLGVNLPTFKWLDILTVQAEYYKSGFNNFERYNSGSLPIWAAQFDTTKFIETATNPQDPSETFFISSNLLALQGGKAVPVANHKDDWKWSIQARKTVNKIFTVYTQVASDHMRLMSGPRQLTASSSPLTSTPKEWYYLIRMEFSLR